MSHEENTTEITLLKNRLHILEVQVASLIIDQEAVKASTPQFEAPTTIPKEYLEKSENLTNLEKNDPF